MPKAVYFIGKVAMVLAIGAAEAVILLAVAVLFFDVSLPSTGAKWLTLAWVSLL
ncbi:MAG: type transport system permease protein, partial [Micromonosporaceae bacterium]|nr:type transport system permease protein [Micromonosporaceae bacterium]